MTDSLRSSDLPPRIDRLPELATDLWWVWNPTARSVFRELDYRLWRETAHNPVELLRRVKRERLEHVAQDPVFLHQYDTAVKGLDRARTGEGTWWALRHGANGAGVDEHGKQRCIAYFSAEFALHQSLPIYAGGLGVLAGDHCKEASDLGLPFVGIGFMYPQGYFHQSVSAEGWQEERYSQIDWQDAPIEPALTPDGKPCVIAVPLGARTVLVSVWHVRLGHTHMYLLDTDLEENAPWDRELSARLYGGDRDTRAQQEIILGIGGVRALRALGISPIVWHLNEGHAAFVVLQRIHEFLGQGHSFESALQEVRKSTVFTTHTPVPAGHDAFPFQLVDTHLSGVWGRLGDHREDFLALGRYDNGQGQGTLFNMTALALRSSNFVNGVSKLHGEVTREMWRPLYGDVEASQVPVTSITNGVHMGTWIATDMNKLFDRYLDSHWRERQDDPAIWERILAIPDDELWHVRTRLRRYLLTFMHDRIRERWMHDRVSATRVVAAGTLLNSSTLTIGFARRFATYKRAELIFRDPERLARILNAPGREVQIIFAGKAHPADDGGKRVLQNVYRHAVDPAFGGRVAFVDDYDLHVAHYLVQGCDVWLNNPRKPLEASGTSGMKASANGGLNVSIGDGWWAEGYAGSNGWLIDPGVTYADTEQQDAADAEALYRLLEDQIVPAFYERDEQNVPRRWLGMVKDAIRTVAPAFCTRRMVKEYVERMYEPAMQVKDPALKG
jgi:starch phosphorylase